MKRALGLLFLLLAFSLPGKADENETRIRQIEEKLRCLVCQNQSLADSSAELATDLRKQVRDQVKAGRSDAEILDFMVQRYGDFVLYQPPLKASTLLLWVGPFVLLAAAALGLVVALRRRRASPEELPLTPDDKRVVERVLGSGAEPRP